MLTQKRKLRDRKQKLTKVYIVLGLILFGGVIAYVISLKLFLPRSIISPLSSNVTEASFYQEEEKTEFIRAELKKKEIEIKSIRQEGDSYIIKLENEAEVVLSAKKDLNGQISSLQFILQRLTMEGRLFSRLDLRYDKPVILLEKK